jgi:hypothetical protein
MSRKEIHSSKKLVTTYKSTRHYIEKGRIQIKSIMVFPNGGGERKIYNSFEHISVLCTVSDACHHVVT